MQLSELRMSANSGPTTFDTVSSTAANETPQTTTAGKTSRVLRQPAITTTRYTGMMIEMSAHNRPTMALSGSSGRPVMPASVVTGMPIDPNATGAVLAIRQMPAA